MLYVAEKSFVRGQVQGEPVYSARSRVRSLARENGLGDSLGATGNVWW